MHRIQEKGPYSNRNFNTVYLRHVPFCALARGAEAEAECLKDAAKRRSPDVESLAVKLEEKLRTLKSERKRKEAAQMAARGGGSVREGGMSRSSLPVGKHGAGQKSGPEEITLHHKVVSGLTFEYEDSNSVWEGLIGFKYFELPGADPKYTLYVRRRGNGKEDVSKWEHKVLAKRRFLPDKKQKGTLKITSEGKATMSEEEKCRLKQRVDEIERDPDLTLVKCDTLW